MPPARSNGRASKACSLCRRYKTRCYSTDSDTRCLRCQTLSQPCSFDESASVSRRDTSPRSRPRQGQVGQRTESDSVHDRLARVERMLETLNGRLDAGQPGFASHSPPQRGPATRKTRDRRQSGPQSAPVLLIRDAASDAGVHSPSNERPGHVSDAISSGIVSPARAKSLLSIFRLHYGRWIFLMDDVPIENLLEQARQSPLLLSSIFLIAVRHSSQELADELAPALFEEAKCLLSSALLDIPQPLAFFQATIILSLWSTTIGQVPLSLDSWLCTGYAVQQALASPLFVEVLKGRDPNDLSLEHLKAWRIWNHICVAHLQYCVGTRRQALITQAQVDACARLIEADDIDNFESRMIAEIKLYWIICQHCSATVTLDMKAMKSALGDWQQSWSALFSQPRSQFLQMGFHFAHLLALSQSLKAPEATMDNTVLTEMLHRSQTIIVIAMNTSDERTRHLTDHIYHVLTFAAITICRLVQTYGSQLDKTAQDMAELDQLVVDLIDWLTSIGLPCHAASILSHVVSSQFKRVRSSFWRTSRASHEATPVAPTTSAIDPFPSIPDDFTLLYSDFIGNDAFGSQSHMSWSEWS